MLKNYSKSYSKLIKKLNNQNLKIIYHNDIGCYSLITTTTNNKVFYIVESADSKNDIYKYIIKNTKKVYGNYILYFKNKYYKMPLLNLSTNDLYYDIDNSTINFDNFDIIIDNYYEKRVK